MITQTKIDVLKIFANDKRLILYRPEWRAITGSVLATILLQQILYWWDKMGRKPFYKFKEPCGNKLYTQGDSWIEELGFSRTEFDTALKKIAVKISSKTPPDPESTHLVEYWTDINRVTYYNINTDTLENVLINLYINQKSNFTQGRNPTLDVNQDSCFTKRSNPDLEIQHPSLDVYPIKSRVNTDFGWGVKPPTETTNIKKTTNNDPDFSPPPPTLPKPISPPSAVFLNESLKVLTNLVIEKNKSPMVNKLIEKEMKHHSLEYLKLCIQYTNAKSNGNQVQYKAFLGKTISNGWAEGYLPESVTLNNSKEDEKYRIFLESRRQMPTAHLKVDAENGCKASAQVLKERSERAAAINKGQSEQEKQTLTPISPKQHNKGLTKISFTGLLPPMISESNTKPRPTV